MPRAPRSSAAASNTKLEIPLAEYGSPAALCEEFVPDLLKLLKLGEDFKRRGWSGARLLEVAARA